MTMYDARTTLSREVVDEVQRYFGNKVFKSIIPRSVKLSERGQAALEVMRGILERRYFDVLREKAYIAKHQLFCLCFWNVTNKTIGKT